jgi:MFS superfamily sulfate permease-like transporter
MAPLLGLIPLAAIAGLLLLIAWSLFDCPAGRACGASAAATSRSPPRPSSPP